MTVVRILFAASFVFFLCVASGELLFHRLNLRFARRERIFLSFVTGAAMVSTAMFLLASARLAYTSVMVIAGLAVIAAWARICRPNFRNLEGLGPQLPVLWKAVFWTPVIVFGVRYLLSAMLPETDPDGTSYHVGLITRFYDHRGFYTIHTNMFAGLAEGIEMLFWIAFALGRHSAACVVEMLFLVAMPFGMLSFGERIGKARAGVVGGLLFYLAPVAGKAGTIGYIDVAAAAVVFATFYLIQIWRKEAAVTLLAPIGLVAGFCFATKLTTSTATIYAVLFVFVVSQRRQGWKQAFRLAAITAAFACVTAGPWLLKDAIQYHNPLFPLFNRWFPNPYQYPSVEAEIRRLFGHTGNVPYSQVPYQITVGGKLFGIVGPIFLFAPITLLALKNDAGRQVFLAFLVAFLPYFSNTGARFMLPALPFLSIAMALVLIDIPVAGPALAIAAVAFHGWISWPGIIDRFVPGFQWTLEPVDIQAALRIKPEAEYFRERWHDYAAGLMLDRFVPRGELVFSLSMGQTAYHHHEMIGSFESALARRAFYTLITSEIGIWANAYLRDLRFAPISTSRIRVRVQENFPTDVRIRELHLFNEDSELKRASNWRIIASRNPWEAPLAFDNDPWSWWTSGDSADPKTWIEADLPSPVSVSRITMLQIEDQRWIRFRPEVLENGSWRSLRFHESDTLAAPPEDLRIRLRDELKSMNLHWIMALDGSPEAEDLRRNSTAWGIQQVAETYHYRLWKLL